MTLQVLGATEQAFLTLAGAVPHTGKVGAAMITVGTALGFERCQFETVPAAPDASAVAAWLHRGTAQIFGGFSQFPHRMRIAWSCGETATGTAGGVHLVSSTHFANYVGVTDKPGEFVLESAAILPSGEEQAEANVRDRQVCEVLNRSLDTVDLSVLAANIFQNSGIEFIWQLVEKSELEVLKILKNRSKVLNVLGDELKKLGLSFGMKFPDGFVKRTE